jgi:hypothetical protein
VRTCLEWLPLKIRSVSAQLLAGLLLAVCTLGITACANRIYFYTTFNYAGRPTPPSGLLVRVMAAYTSGVGSGGLEILDAQHDLRSNIQNTTASFHISGYSESIPTTIINYPEQETGYVLSSNDGALYSINYAKESSNGAVNGTGFGANAPSAATDPTGATITGAYEAGGQLVVIMNGSTYAFSLPNVYKVAVNPGNSIVLAMTRNSNSLYRIVKLPASTTPVIPPGSVDCEPLLLPTFCVVPVGGAYDHPNNVNFSLDGASAYILNCGPECGGTASSVTVLQTAALVTTNVPTVNPTSAAAPSPLVALPVANPVPIPGGATIALPDATSLYIAGQSLQNNGLLAGNLTLLNLTTFKAGAPISISDGSHTRMIFGDNNTLWIGASQCANGPRAAAANSGNTTQAANYNCLSRYTIGSTFAGGSNAVLPGWSKGTAYTAGAEISDGTNIQVAQGSGTSGSSTPSWSASVAGTTTDGGVKWVNIGAVSAVQIIPAVTPNNNALQVLYPNTNQNLAYYGSLTGICYVESYGKMYTAYGGQIHAFNTVDGSEINNFNITVQGTVLDVAFMDATTNAVN